MRIVESVTEMQKLALGLKRKSKAIGLVPTMGYLHAGHMSLVKTARKELGRAGTVILSIYVNPTQFAPHEDLSRYPRDLQRDIELCKKAGVDVIFAPRDSDMYPAGSYSTYVVEEALSSMMEGVARPTHFRGVATVVAKLFNITLPDLAVFGSKDFQQAAVIRRMIENLNFPVKLIVAPTVREKDGLALSSRNVYLTGESRQQALVLSQAIKLAQGEVKKKVKAVELKQRLRKTIERAPSARVDYIEFFDPNTLQPVSEVGKGSHLALAVFIGATRLIDNASL